MRNLELKKTLRSSHGVTPILYGLLVLVLGNTAKADVIVDIGSITMNSGTLGSPATASVDVFARSPSLATFGQFSLGFEISLPVGSVGTLQFRESFDGTTDAAKQLSTERDSSNYVLGADRAAITEFKSDRNGNNFRQLVQSDEVTGLIAGFVGPGNTITLDMTPKLIATLELEHISGAPVSSTFEISLLKGDDTFFRRFNGFTPTDVNVNDQSFSQIGTVTVAVPEPSCFVAGLVALMGTRFRRRRRSASILKK